MSLSRTRGRLLFFIHFYQKEGELMNMQEALRQLQNNPAEFFRQAGVNVPQEIMNDPQKMAMHLINSGKVSNPVLQMVMPMIRRMGG